MSLSATCLRFVQKSSMDELRKSEGVNGNNRKRIARAMADCVFATWLLKRPSIRKSITTEAAFDLIDYLFEEIASGNGDLRQPTYRRIDRMYREVLCAL